MLLALPTLALLLAPPPLPELRTEATDAGSRFHVRNMAAQPLKAFLIELVNYPGSFYMYWHDETTAAPIPPGGSLEISITNMTVGAAPEYVKLQAALYADGVTAGSPEKIAQLLDRRRHLLATTRQLIARLEQSTPAALRQWAESIPSPTRANRATQSSINDVAAKALILDTAARLESTPPAAILTALRKTEQALAN